jgi:predicted O-linked N-acetylglucosamine transferase (SPINDLY family)
MKKTSTKTPSRPTNPATIDPAKLFAAAQDAHRSGRLQDAIYCYQQILASYPSHPDTLHLLGMAHFQSGQVELAAQSLRQAVQSAPQPVFLSNLGTVLKAQNKLAEAEDAYRQALALAPDYAEGHFNLAVLLQGQQRLEEAAQSYRQALSLMPDYLAAYFNLGLLYLAQGRLGEAEAALRKAIELKPDYAEAHFNLGVLMQQQERWDEAYSAYAGALAARPDFADAYFNTGVALKGLKRPEEAVQAYGQAVRCRPEWFDAWYRLGALLQELGRDQEAESAYRQALALKPGAPEVCTNLGNMLAANARLEEAEILLTTAAAANPDNPYNLYNLGNLFLQQQRYEAAEPLYREVLRLEPGFSHAHFNLANLLYEQRRYEEAEAAYLHAYQLDPSYRFAAARIAFLQRHQCKWEQLAELDDELLALLQDGQARDISPFITLTVPAVDGSAQKEAGRLYAEFKHKRELDRPSLVDPAARPEHERLRVGYLSADFHEHATMHLLSGVLERHDRSQFDIHLYSYGPDTQDATRLRLKSRPSAFHDIASLSDEEAARRIAADGIDLLIDLKGYTQDNRLGISALRPAPVLVSWLGYPATLGHPRLADFLIGDPVTTPAEHAGQYSELLAQLPHCYQPNDNRRQIGTRPSRQQAGLPEVGLVFCSFNQSYKFSADIFDLWCRLLLEVPGSVLWLLDTGVSTSANLRREAGRRGVGPERLLFAPSLPQAEHLARLQLADLALDTFPVTSHTTASDALWAGVPLITLRGETFVSRVAASLLTCIGVPELVTENREDYLALALALARSPGQLAALREKIAAGLAQSPLYDTERFTRDLEALYRQIWQQQRAGIRQPILAKS